MAIRRHPKRSPVESPSAPTVNAEGALPPEVRTFLDAVPDAVALLSSAHTVVWVNSAFATLFGYAEAEAVGRPINVLIIPPTYTDEAENVRMNLQSGAPQFLDTLRQHRDGSLIAVTVSATPVRLDGKLHALAYYRQDERRREAELQRAALLEQLETQRQTLEITLTQMPAGVFIAEGRAGDIVFANNQARAILERLARAAPDRPLAFEGFGPDGTPYTPAMWPIVRSLEEAVGVSGCEFRLRTVDQGWMVLRVSSGPVPVHADAPPRAVAVLEDVTAERAAEHAYRTLVEQSLQGFALMRVGQVLFANDRFAAAFGWNAEELKAMTPEAFFQQVHPDDREAVLARAHERVETSQSTSERHRVRILTRDNEVRWLEVAACRVFIDGEPTSQLSTYDITDYVQLEEHLQRAQHFEAIGQLAAGISHEINTPAQYATDNVRFAHDALTRAVSACQACTQSTTAPLADEFQEVPEALTDALDGLKRIRAIVQGVKAFAHPGDEESRPLDLGLLIDKAIDVSKNEWKHDATVSRSYSPDLPPVQCREAAFGQAMLNILVNSAQAIRERRRADAALEGHIAVAIRHDPTHVLITIQDNGVGIPREQQRRVFEPFFTTKAIGEGTGYGLSQVYNTVQGHHGTIWIESAENQGTTLTIRLPLASPEGSSS